MRLNQQPIGRRSGFCAVARRPAGCPQHALPMGGRAATRRRCDRRDRHRASRSSARSACCSQAHQGRSLAPARALPTLRPSVHARAAGLAGALKKIAGYTGRPPPSDRRGRAHDVRARVAVVHRACSPPSAAARADQGAGPDVRSARFEPPLAAARAAAHSALADQPGGARARRGRGSARARRGTETPEVGGALRAAPPPDPLGARSRDSSLLLVVALALERRRPRGAQLGLVEPARKNRAAQCELLCGLGACRASFGCRCSSSRCRR